MFEAITKVLNGHPFTSKRSSLENPTTPLSNPAAWLVDLFGGGRTRAGRTVTVESAMSLSPINRAVRLICETITSLQVVIDAPEGHYLHRLFANVSPFYTRPVLFGAVQYDALAGGNGLMRIIRTSKTDPTPNELRLIQAKNVHDVIPSYKDGIIFYTITNEYGQRETLTQNDVVHIPCFSADGIWGRSLITMMKDTIGQMLIAQDYMTELLEKGGKLEGIVMTPMGYSPTAKTNIEESWSTKKRGVKVLEEGLKYMPVSAKPTDMGYSALYIQLIREAARIIGVPAAFLEEDSQSTFSNFEQKGVTLVIYCLRPWIKIWEHELNRKLVLPSQQGKVSIRFNMNSLLRGDSKARGELYNAMQQGFGITPNEIRSNEDLPPMDGGDVLIGPMNFTQLKNLENNVGTTTAAVSE